MSLNLTRMIKAVELAAGQPGGLDYQQELEELYELREPTDLNPRVYTFDRKDKEGVMRHIASLEVKL